MNDVKPCVNLTKKAYAKVVEHFRANVNMNLPPGDVDVFVGVLRDALRVATGFDPEAKSPKELCEKQYAQRKTNAENEGTTLYAKYKKPRLMKLKAEFPDVPTALVYNASRHTIENYQR
jgi:hypothetical protein